MVPYGNLLELKSTHEFTIGLRVVIGTGLATAILSVKVDQVSVAIGFLCQSYYPLVRSVNHKAAQYKQP